MQRVIITMFLWPRGLDLEEHMGPWWRLLLLNMVFVVQVLYSRWWFQRFEFGPIEWAWRSLTWFRL